MTTEKVDEAPQTPETSSATRRDFMKVAGVGALGIAYTHPIVETLNSKGQITQYDQDPSDPSSKPSDPEQPAL